MRRRLVGPTRLLLAGGLGAGLVLLSQHGGLTLDLRPATSGATGSATAGSATAGTREAALQQRMLPCSGQELSGVDGAADIPLTGTVTAVSPPADLLAALALPGAADQAERGSLDIRVGDAKPTGAARSTSPAQRVRVALPKGTAEVSAQGQGALAPGLTGGQEWRSDTNTLRGLAGTACVTPAAEHWLLAGGGAAGRQERLVLANAGGNEVSVAVSVLGAKGPVEEAGNRAVVVPAGGRAVLLLDAIAGSEPAPVVHVVVTGGTVSATITDTWLDGAVPAGAETVAPAAAPSATQVIPITRLDQAGSLRIAVPGDTQAVVSARLITGKGPRPLSEEGVHRVQAHSVLELPLRAGTGIQAVEVRSDVPVLAAAFSQVRAEGEVGDFAWSAATPAIETLAGASFPTGQDAPRRTLSLVASGGRATAEVTLSVAGKVTTSRVDLGADAVTVKDLGSPDAVWVRRVSGGGALHAGVLSSLGEGATTMISALGLTDLPLTSRTTSALPLP